MIGDIYAETQEDVEYLCINVVTRSGNQYVVAIDASDTPGVRVYAEAHNLIDTIELR